MKEIFKDVPGYEGYYQASNQGRVKSLNRNVKHPYGNVRFIKRRILKPCIVKGYYCVRLSKKGKCKTYPVHILIALTFLDFKQTGHGGLIMDHINNIKTDNRLENLQIITNRENTSKDRKNGTSKYVGVSWCKTSKKWRSYIYLDGKNKFLGYFKDQYKAHLKYQEELKLINKLS